MLTLPKRLAGVHPDLAQVVRVASAYVDVEVLEGLRTLARQRQLVAAGASQTLRSRHLTGHAVDLGALVRLAPESPLMLRWDWPLYAGIATAMKRAAAELKVPIEWGGDWRSLRDGPHFQLPWARYPPAKET